MQRINKVFLLVSLLCCNTWLFAAADSIKEQDLAIIQQMDNAQQIRDFFQQDQEFFKTNDPQINIREKSIEEILNMPSIVDGQLSIEKILEQQFKPGKQQSLTAEEFAKVFSSGSKQPAPEEPNEKQWTNVMKHSRVGP
jgi:hypothetical protein